MLNYTGCDVKTQHGQSKMTAIYRLCQSGVGVD